MDTSSSLTDPTDWLPTPLPQLSVLETALRCQVCKDFYDTPMLTSCSHTFCSLCIRRCLSAEGRCPACRASEQASKLRRNWALEEAVAGFRDARSAVLEVAIGFEEGKKRKREGGGEDGVGRPGKRKRGEGKGEVEGRRQTRSQSKRIGEGSVMGSQDDVVVVDDEDGNYLGQEGEEEARDSEYEDEEREKKTQDGLVPCPMCGKRMKEEAVFAHLDRCEEEQKGQRRQIKSVTPAYPIHQHPPSRPSSAKPQERLPELNYSLLKDNAMRKKLSELGIPSWGSKGLMIRRHTEWINLWNSNCDSARPRTKRELLQDLDSWERSQGGHAREGTSAVNGVMKKDFDSQGWATSNKSDFDRLIEDARRKRNAKLEKQNDTQTETETGPPTTSNGDDPNERPYDDNPDAMASIREKVAAAENGTQAEPSMNMDFRSTQNGRETGTRDTSLHSSAPPVPGSQNGSLLGQARFGHPETNGAPGVADSSTSRDTASSESGMADHWRNPGVRRIPMFEVPEDPVMDVDRGR